MSFSSFKQFCLELGRQVGHIAIHGISMTAAILFMALNDATLALTMGHDVRVYDAIPLRYFIQTIDVVVVLRFALNAWRGPH